MVGCIYYPAVKTLSSARAKRCKFSPSFFFHFSPGPAFFVAGGRWGRGGGETARVIDTPAFRKFSMKFVPRSSEPLEKYRKVRRMKKESKEERARGRKTEGQYGGAARE